MTMLELIFPPAFILILGAFLIGPIRAPLRPLVVLGAPLLTLYAIWQMGDGIQLTAQFLNYEIQLIESSPLRRLFATIFAIMAFVGGLFAFRRGSDYHVPVLGTDGHFFDRRGVVWWHRGSAESGNTLRHHALGGWCTVENRY
jgi:hypothetical protein